MRKLRFLALLCAGIPALAWGPEGHDLVARIAEAQLTAAAWAQVAAILGPGSTMQSVSSWADQIRRSRPETAPWHYVDIPINRPGLDMARDCPKDNCVIAAIASMRARLQDASLPADQRREALMFLIHFVGDMHQPLHSSDNGDKGGNEVHIVFRGQPGNLHGLWDSGLLGRMGKEDELFATWSAASARHRKKFAKGTVGDWAEQAHKLAQQVVYAKLPRTAPGAPIEIGADYERRADGVIELQIERAGARLAAVLNQDLR
ncbi:MAG: S1/P1 nuclease [Bryobacteraceae bacterium]